MTRETKVGLGIATTFLCLVSLTVASKLRGPEASAAVADVRPTVAGAGDAKSGGIKPSASRGDKPPDAQPEPPAPPGPGALPAGPPSLNINHKPPTPSLPAALPKGLPQSPDTPALAAVPLVSDTPAPRSGWWGRYVESADGPAGTPLSEIAAQPGTGAAPSLPMPAPVTVAQAEAQVKSPNDPIQLPAVAAPISDPPMAPMGGIGKPEAPIPAVPVVPNGPLEAQRAIPLPPPPSDPIQVKLPTDSANNNQDPIHLPPPPSIAPRTGIGGTALPTPPGGNPTMPPADPVLTPPNNDPGIAVPAKSSIATERARPEPKSIGTIGPTGNEVAVSPLQPPPLTGSATPVLGAGVAGAAVPALSAAGRALPKVISHTDDVHPVGAGETTFAQLSQRWYSTDKYADALLEYNRRHLMNRGNPGLLQNPPRLAANQPIYYPQQNVLESDFASYLPKAAGSAVPTISRPPVVEISRPTPLNATPSEATVSYRVPATDWVGNIATRTLGNFDAWRDILRLNPALRTDLQIPAGTVLRLPANARTD